MYRRTSAGVADAVATSALARVLGLLAAWTRESFVYRWLTTEPDPAVVVDLRETVTLGPFVAALDRAGPRFERWWFASGVNRALVAARVRTPWDALAEARTVRLLAAALEPPEPPEENHRQ